jgi:hypothetical protein
MALFRAQLPPTETGNSHIVAGVSLKELLSTQSGPSALQELGEAAHSGPRTEIAPAVPAADDDETAGEDETAGKGGGGMKRVAASDGKDANASPGLWATGIAILLFVIGLFAAVQVFDTPSSGPTYTPTEGVGIFALFYVVAQAVERSVEMAMPLLEKLPGFNKSRKQVELDQFVETFYANAAPGRAVNGRSKAAAQAAENAAKHAANKQAEIDQLRANRTMIMFGLTAGLGMSLCGYLEADFLTTVGARFGDNPNVGQQTLMMAVTGLIVGGGSKQLHDLITNVSKAKDRKATPAETGGQR